jgi:GNAT superfamily N-acetyltransferase
MTSAKEWRATRNAAGPFPIRTSEIDALNQVFSDAFTERYRRDGMVGVRVPYLNPAIWQYAIEDSDGGALLWRGEHEEIVAFNVVHRSGVEGWMGPLAVRPDWQGTGLGKEIVRAGVAKLHGEKAAVIGLETMPRTMDNIGFYSRLGFVPGRLTITVTLEASTAERQLVLLGRLNPRDRDDVLAECTMLTQRQLQGYDFSREIRLTLELGLGDAAIFRDGTRLAGFALFHTAPLVDGRAREELRVLKLVVERELDVVPLVVALADVARKAAVRRVAVRVQGEYPDSYRRLMGAGARVRWTDLRMCVAGCEERRPGKGMVLSNWEI